MKGAPRRGPDVIPLPTPQTSLANLLHLSHSPELASFSSRLARTGKVAKDGFNLERIKTGSRFRVLINIITITTIIFTYTFKKLKSSTSGGKTSFEYLYSYSSPHFLMFSVFLAAPRSFSRSDGVLVTTYATYERRSRTRPSFFEIGQATKETVAFEACKKRFQLLISFVLLGNPMNPIFTNKKISACLFFISQICKRSDYPVLLPARKTKHTYFTPSLLQRRRENPCFGMTKPAERRNPLSPTLSPSPIPHRSPTLAILASKI